MPFESLGDKLQSAFKDLRGRGKLSESDIDGALREVRRALLEADVNFKVAKDFIAHVREKAVGEEVFGSLKPDQTVIKIVRDELTDLLGGTQSKITLSSSGMTIIMLVGLQGAGKTTTAGKLALMMKKKGHRPMMVACDVYRPAAADQLKVITEQAGADNFAMDANQKPLTIAKDALAHAKRYFYDVLIVDTAGRLSIDEAMMNEVAELHDELKPSETMFVADAMLGQTAVQAAQAFNERLSLTGVILTKLDGDSRGGAALSVAYTTGKPIKFVGVSEKIDGLEPFNAEGMASRILGMGDIVALVKDVQKAIDVEQTQKLAQKMKAGNKFDLNDFKAQLAQMKNMGSFSGLMEKLPTQFAEAASKINDDDAQKAIARTEGIINSMTPFERMHPDIIKASRKRRIAAGAGVPVQEVNKMLKQFEQTQTMMKSMQKGGLAKMMRALGGLNKFGGGLGGLGGFGNFGRH